MIKNAQIMRKAATAVKVMKRDLLGRVSIGLCFSLTTALAKKSLSISSFDNDQIATCGDGDLYIYDEILNDLPYFLARPTNWKNGTPHAQI
jgi:hypothetical protein